MESIPFYGNIIEVVSVMNDVYEMDCYIAEDDMVSVEGPANEHILLNSESFIEAVKLTIRSCGAEEVAEYYSYLTGKKYIPYKETGESDEHPETVLIMTGWNSNGNSNGNSNSKS